MAQQLGGGTALPEDLDLIPHTLVMGSHPTPLASGDVHIHDTNTCIPMHTLT